MKNSRLMAMLLLCALLLSALPSVPAAPQTQKRGIRVRKQEPPRKPPTATDEAAAEALKKPSAEATSAAQAGKPRLVLQLGQRTMTYGFAAFSSDGRLVVTGGGTDVVVWD